MQTTFDESRQFALSSVELAGFRGLKRVRLTLARVNVLVGVNGAGKSSVLQAVAALLNEFVLALMSEPRHVFKPAAEDFHRGETEISFEGWFCDEGRDIAQSLTVSWQLQAGRVVKRSPEWLFNEGEQIAVKMRTGENPVRPLFCSYPPGQQIDSPDLNKFSEPNATWLDAYEGAFGVRDFGSFFHWFRIQEDLENETRLNSSAEFRLPQLEAVRRAVEHALPEFVGLRVQRSPGLRLVMQKRGQTMSLQQMSDGERGLITLVGDIARRACLLNPRLEDPLTTPGVVLIDEIEQHLHPQWQRRIVQILPKVFPNIQFLVTTHSPIVCNSVRPSELLVLRDGEALSATAYGWSVQDVLREVFEINDRPQDIEERLSDLDKALDEADIEEARRIVAELSLLLPSTDAELVRAGVLLPFLEQEQGSEGG